MCRRLARKFSTREERHMTTVFEPIGAGIMVALFNKFVINNHWLWQQCASGGGDRSAETGDEECTSSSSTTTIDTVEVHAHF